MECPGISNVKNIDSNDEQESKNNCDGRFEDIFNVEHVDRVKTKITTVNIERENGNLGITLRGGFHQNSDLSRPVTITYVKPDGPAAKQGTIKPGDRLLAVDGVSLQGSTLNDAQTLLLQPSATALLTIEYDVNVLDSVEHAYGPLLVEIEKSYQQQLGLTLLQNESGIFIERVKLGSLADRCGALHVGDKILAVNATRIHGSCIELEDVTKILEQEYPVIRLEILPVYAASSNSNHGIWKTKDFFGSTVSGVSTLKNNSNRKKDFKKEEKDTDSDFKIHLGNLYGVTRGEIALTHAETIHTTLTRENGSFGLFVIDSPEGSIIISSIFLNSPAERCQSLCPGDRILAVNHRSVILDNLTANDVNNLLETKPDGSPCYRINLLTEFDVLDTVVPSSGIFLVKLVKRGCAELGITMMASKSSGFIVCEIKKGSLAYRAGSLIPGDRILAINSIPLDECSIEYAIHIFNQSTNIVTLKVQRNDSNRDFRNYNRKITYTVDLQRYGGPLGITIAGSEELSYPITVSGLTAGGLAEQTGVIHVGDEILAINNHSLYGEPLSKAHSLLNTSSDLVSLKLSRPLIPMCRLSDNRSPILPPSIDSAVESWDSSHLDLAPSPEQQKPTKDIRGKRNPSATTTQMCPIMSDMTSSKEEKENSDADFVLNLENSNDSDLAILDEITSENLKIKRELDILSIKLDEQRKSKVNQSENKLNSPQINSILNTDVENSDFFFETFPRTHSKSLTKFPSGKKKLNNGDVYKDSSTCSIAEKHQEELSSFCTNNFDENFGSYESEMRKTCESQAFELNHNQDSEKCEFQSSQLYEVTLHKDPVYEDFGFSVSDGLYERGVFINRIRKSGPADLSNVLKPYDRILQVNNTYTQDFDCCLTVPLIASAGNTLNLLVARNPEKNDSDTILNCEKFQKKELSTATNLINSNNEEGVRRIVV
ncbi:conserved hypothetical protein [Pediculus humanus corporis]|uniref:PDZ domain-containing protein n=1 Tax=Pediculus humanus subsp. corporis TaxID=121224 RepID=E0VFP1_PEDHC|nr:uncharacterized protein Phum_PHUM163890 [Pediculus humanus corporis]EEB12197.1 conserved hypothetical protein [Pediculus humanus corporis]